MATKAAKATDRYSVVNGWYVVSVGYKQTRTGNKGPARFYLSRVDDDPKGIQADAAAAFRRQQWDAIRKAGHDVWPESLLDSPLPASVAAIDVPPPSNGSPSALAPLAPITVPAISVRPATKNGPTVREAVRTYLDQRYKGKASHGTVTTATYRLETAAEYLGMDGQMGAVDEAKIRTAVETLCSRPAVRSSGRKDVEGNGRKVNPEDRISVITAKAAVQALRMFLDWANSSDDSGGFTKPRQYDLIFKTRPVIFDSERRARAAKKASGREVERYEVGELAHLYRWASPQQRLWILLMLNCGFANEELNDLHRSEVYLDAKKPYIARIRKKTVRFDRDSDGVYGQWELWPETVAALKVAMAVENPDNSPFVLRTHHGNRLIEPTDKGRKDAVYVSWQRLYDSRIEPNVKKADRPRWLPPKYVRKTGAHLIRTSGLNNASELADMYLCHAEQGIITAYAGRDWSALSPALAHLRQQLEPIFKAAKLGHDRKKQTGEEKGKATVVHIGDVRRREKKAPEGSAA